MDSSSPRIFYPVSLSSYQAPPPGSRRAAFGDTRLQQRHDLILERMVSRQSCIVSELSSESRERMGSYRFFNSPSVQPAELIHMATRLPEDAVSGGDLLVLSDTVSVPFSCHKRRPDRWRNGLGVVDDNRSPGLYGHAALCMAADSERILGLASMAVFTRPYVACSKPEKLERRAKRNRLPYWEKERSVWPLVAREASAQLGAAARVTHVMDRAADTRETLAALQLLPPGHFAVVRQSANRPVESPCGGRVGIRELLATAPVSGRVALQLRGLGHYSKTHGRWVHRQARECLLDVRHVYVQPTGRDQKLHPLWAVHALERADTVPPGEQAVEWVLWCTMPVGSMSDAVRVLDAYRKRWWVEQLYRVLKKDGLNIEGSMLENPENIKKQFIMAMQTSAQVLKLVSVREGKVFVPITEIFDEQDRQLLEKLNRKLEGTGENSKVTNPHNRQGLAWAAWIIARLGGWSGLASQRPPGPKTMSRGMERFANLKWFDNDV